MDQSLFPLMRDVVVYFSYIPFDVVVGGVRVLYFRCLEYCGVSSRHFRDVSFQPRVDRMSKLAVFAISSQVKFRVSIRHADRHVDSCR